jgi:uncharacterized protein YciI
MFVVELTYTGSLSRVDELLDDHMTWLKSDYETDVFIASGPQGARDGSVIIAVGNNKAVIETLRRQIPSRSPGSVNSHHPLFRHHRRPTLDQYRDSPV